MKSPRTARRKRAICPRPQLEQLESRTLLSFTIGGITIPTIPGINLSGLTLPTVTNQFNLGNLSSLSNPPASDKWWLNNTGQTLSNPTSGPATGTPGADINALNAWNITTGNSNVVIAVLDTGIDLNNPALASVLWTNPGNLTGDPETGDLHGWNFLDNNNNVQDNFVHGTAVAAAIHSVAPGVTILPVEIGTAAGVNDTALVNGINYLIALKKAGVNIVAINASYISFTPPTAADVSAITAAGNAGMLYVAAAGNAGMNLDSLIPNIPSSLAKYIPQFLPSNLVFVAATDNQDNLASFSDYGKYTVAIGAPGVDITLPIAGSNGSLYTPLSGTSFAAPMVSATAALLESKFPTATMSQIKSAILNSGDLDPALAGKTSTGRRLDAYNALNYMLGNIAPTGAVSIINTTVISGWAFDANLGAAPATVKITIDGKTAALLQANGQSDDMTATLGSADHGFSFDASTIPYGKHKIQVYVADNVTGKFTLIGQGNLTVDVAPLGALESADAKTITGWAYDPDTLAKSVNVKIYIDGKAATIASANVARTDLTFPANADGTTTVKHGFVAHLGALKAGLHRIDVYAVDTLTGALTLIGSTTISSNRPATGLVESLDATAITGWAFDADAGGTAIQVQYQIDSFPPIFTTANLARPDLKTLLGSQNHGFYIALPYLTTGDHTVTVWAVDPNNKQLIQLTSQTLAVTAPAGDPLPTGTITITNTQVTGTVDDPGKTDPITMRIDVTNAKGVTTSYATTAIADPVTGIHGFTFALPAVTGVCRVDAYALDDQTLDPVLLASQLINYTVPTATVESFTAAGAAGYAVAPSAPATSSNRATAGIALIRLDVDGLAGAIVCANLARPDLLGSLGRSNVGFNISMPQLAPGSHTATLYLIDPTTLVATALGQISFSTT